MIRLEHVSKAYEGGVNAVNDVSFEVPRGEIAILVGPSGCGKTTTLKMINRLHEPASGKIFVDDVDTSTVDPIELRRNIGYLIQDVGLFPHGLARVPVVGPEGRLEGVLTFDSIRKVLARIDS